MTYSEDGVTLLIGHVLDVLASLPAESVDCCITSPPYFSLRKYAAADVVWGGTEGCEHEWGTALRVGGGKQDPDGQRWQHTNGGVSGHAAETSATCRRCGAWRGQFGLEPTPDVYVEHTIAVLRAVRRVLKPTGVVFWNIGDGYASNPAKGGSGTPNGRNNRGENYSRSSRTWGSDGPKAKDLVLMPERVALAAQADGWWVRSRIAWTKPNPMPESVRDRPTDAWEHIWMFTKAARYWWDAEAVREPANGTTPHDLTGQGYAAPGQTRQNGNRAHSRGRESGDGAYQEQRDSYKGWHSPALVSHRNLRNVWEFPTAPFPAAHFATFPPELPERCIKASCPPDGTVLDCFTGSGTTLLVARRLGRRAIGIELSEEYAQMAIERLRYGTKGLMQLAHGQAPLPLEGETP